MTPRTPKTPQTKASPAKLWMKWFGEVVDDPKLRRAARLGARHNLLLPWVMAWSKQHDRTNRGRIVLGSGLPATADDLAESLSLLSATATAEAIGEALEEWQDPALFGADGVILVRDADGVLRFASWAWRSGSGTRPGNRPSESKARVNERARQYRERVRARRDAERAAGARHDAPVVTHHDEKVVTPHHDASRIVTTPVVTRITTRHDRDAPEVQLTLGVSDACITTGITTRITTRHDASRHIEREESTSTLSLAHSLARAHARTREDDRDHTDAPPQAETPDASDVAQDPDRTAGAILTQPGPITGGGSDLAFDPAPELRAVFRRGPLRAWLDGAQEHRAQLARDVHAALAALGLGDVQRRTWWTRVGAALAGLDSPQYTAGEVDAALSDMLIRGVPTHATGVRRFCELIRQRAEDDAAARAEELKTPRRERSPKYPARVPAGVSLAADSGAHGMTGTRDL